MEKYRGCDNLVQESKNLKKARFVKFDIQEFYPSITSDLLDRALDYASTMTNITDDEREIVKLSQSHFCSTEKGAGSRNQVQV